MISVATHSVSAGTARCCFSHTGEPSFLPQPRGSSAALSAAAPRPSLTNQHSTAAMVAFLSLESSASITVRWPLQVCPASPLASPRDGEKWLPRRQALSSRVRWTNRQGYVSAEPPPRCLRWMSCLQSRWRSSSHIYTAVSPVSRQRLWPPRERP